ncbi:hypothetical protein [Pseudomonas sp. CCOS 191]|uniref:hypothetical protein n=1 Tax=Pseudomonas sp. CCOS 191 TaxID=1649877 RepID=UPI0006247487|nr:hypothetical protein [Pseudomonas sp. CCOS 191]CRI56408.1 hypothetical protein CCOS191_1872 [Pseudomonas sp. CCOS 191]
MSDPNEQIAQLTAALSSLKDEFQALKAGNAAALAAISAALREIPGYKPKVMEQMLTHTLKHGWPLSGLPDNEITETAFSAPLRFLLNDQQEARTFFRGQ